jgi:peptidyl-prolyl cis-trans isomerase A (cyclophilin A)
MRQSFPPRRALARLIVPTVTAALVAACGGGDGAGSDARLVRPDPAALSAPAPDSFKVAVETSKGNFTIVARRDWAPRGVDRFYHLVQLGFYDEARFFRVLRGFMAQFGLHGDPRVNAAWDPLSIPDDPVKQTNRRGTVSYAMAGPNTRTTQLFINYSDNANLDGMGFAPIGEVIDGMATVDSLYANYGEGAPDGSGPDQSRIATQGNAYLTQNFPRLDFIRRARVVPF